MLTKPVFLFNVGTVHDTDQYDLDLFIQNISLAGFLNIGDYVKDTAANEYEIIAGTIPFSDGGTLTVQAVTNNVQPVEDTDYDSEWYTPNQANLRPEMQTGGSIGSSALFSAPDYEYTIVAGWTNPAQDALAVVGDRVVDLNGREFEITFIDGGSRFSVAFRMKEVEREAISPVLGSATLYRPTSIRGFFQGSFTTAQALNNINNRDNVIVDPLVGAGGGGGGSNGSFVPEYHDITAGEETAKQFNLSNVPDDPTEVIVDVLNGSSLKPIVDYTISGSVFNWSGLGVDGILAENDCIRIIYFTP